MKLSLSRSTLRSFRPGDAPALTRHAGNYRVARNLSALPHPYTLQHGEEWIAHTTSATPQTHFAITIDDEVIGGIGIELGDPTRLAVCDHCGEIGYWLGEPFWGRGIVSEAASALTEWAFANLPVVRLHAAVYARNLASVRVLEKAGYTFEGRLRARYFRDGEFIDGLLYANVRLPS